MTAHLSNVDILADDFQKEAKKISFVFFLFLQEIGQPTAHICIRLANEVRKLFKKAEGSQKICCW